MGDMRGLMLIDRDTVFKGKIANCSRIDIYGYVDGELAADTVIVHEGGQLYGKVRSETAEVGGTVQGEMRVKHLIRISSSGAVRGDVVYGELALEAGGDLSAEVRNIPPSLAGDLMLLVRRGQSVVITSEDLSALDPDDAATDLTYSVSNAAHGHIALIGAPAVSIETFTETDIRAGGVLFQHDGTNGSQARFDVIVSDASGSTSGAPRTVSVAVR